MTNPSEFDLPSGRRLYLRGIRQYLTYEGLIEGLPTAEKNCERLEQLAAGTWDKSTAGYPVHLIRPTERPVDYPGDEQYPFGTPSALPAITCIGRFDSLQPARDEACYYSSLVVIWFQDEFAFPIDLDVVSQIQAIDWETEAVDLDY
jgi:hypothetical protein